MTPYLRPLHCIALLASASLAASAHSQAVVRQTSSPQGAPAPATPPVEKATAALSEPIFDLSFPGGTVAQYAEALRRAAPGINVVVMPDAAQVVLPNISLSGVAPRTAVNLLDQQIHGGGPRLDTSETTSAIFDRTGVRTAAVGQPAFVISVRRGNESQAASHATNTRVLSLARLLEGGTRSAAVVLQAIEVAVKASGFESLTTLAYHEPTTLLIVNGPEPAVEAADNVVGTLAPRRATADPKALDELRAELMTTTVQLQRAMTEGETRNELLNSALRSREEELRDLRQQVAAATIERKAAEADATRSRNMLDSIDARARELTNEVDRLKTRIATLEDLLRRNNIKFN